jgi:hypothetical protein
MMTTTSVPAAVAVAAGADTTVLVDCADAAGCAAPVGADDGVAVTTTVTAWAAAGLLDAVGTADPPGVEVLEAVAVGVPEPVTVGVCSAAVALAAISAGDGDASGEPDATGEAALFVFCMSFGPALLAFCWSLAAALVAVGEERAATAGSSAPRIGSAGRSEVTPPLLRPTVGLLGETGAGARTAGASAITFPTVVPVAGASATIAASGSPVAASTAVNPPTASRNPTIAVAPIVTMAPRETMPNACCAAVGEVTTVLTTPSWRRRRAEKPAATSRRSRPSSGARTTSLTLEPIVAPIIAPTSVPWTPAQEVKIAPQMAARPAVTMPER